MHLSMADPANRLRGCRADYRDRMFKAEASAIGFLSPSKSAGYGRVRASRLQLWVGMLHTRHSLCEIVKHLFASSSVKAGQWLTSRRNSSTVDRTEELDMAEDAYRTHHGKEPLLEMEKAFITPIERDLDHNPLGGAIGRGDTNNSSYSQLLTLHEDASRNCSYAFTSSGSKSLLRIFDTDKENLCCNWAHPPSIDSRTQTQCLQPDECRSSLTAQDTIYNAE